VAGSVRLITADLMFGSKVEAMIRSAGFEPTVTAAVPERGDDDALWVVDLAQGDFAPEDVAGRGAPVLAFYSHVDDDTQRRAIEAGIDQVVPRSRMAREGADLIAARARS
jgi:hypothetical protein